MSRFSLENGKYEEILVRTTLPVRDVALSPDGNWIAVASEYVYDFRCSTLLLIGTVNSS